MACIVVDHARRGLAITIVLAVGCTQIGGPYDGDDMSPNTEPYEASAGSGETTAATTVEAVVSWCRDHDVWVDTIGAIARRVASLARSVPPG